MGERAKSRTPLSVRIPDDLARRLDRLVPKIAKDQNLAAFGRVSRSAVVKLALLRGVAVLEAEYK
jgi:predicted transcriptional regulator